jgi:hypothetical protein
MSDKEMTRSFGGSRRKIDGAAERVIRVQLRGNNARMGAFVECEREIATFILYCISSIPTDSRHMAAVHCVSPQ